MASALPCSRIVVSVQRHYIFVEMPARGGCEDALAPMMRRMEKSAELLSRTLASLDRDIEHARALVCRAPRVNEIEFKETVIKRIFDVQLGSRGKQT